VTKSSEIVLIAFLLSIVLVVTVLGFTTLTGMVTASDVETKYLCWDGSQVDEVSDCPDKCRQVAYWQEVCEETQGQDCVAKKLDYNANVIACETGKTEGSGLVSVQVTNLDSQSGGQFSFRPRLKTLDGKWFYTSPETHYLGPGQTKNFDFYSPVPFYSCEYVEVEVPVKKECGQQTTECHYERAFTEKC
jgi:hypothetical protein